MKITEVEHFPKELLRKKSVSLYKAFIIHDQDEVMNIDSNIDILAITEEAAVTSLVNELPLDEAMDIKGKIISFAIFKLLKDDFVTKPVVDHGDVFFNRNMLSITLKNKIFDVDVKDMRIEDITIDIDPKTEYRICSNIKLSKA